MPNDRALLRQYSRSRDPEAFAALVRRHAGMVYGVCLRVTGNAHDAEDVAQECFLELARKARSIVSSLPGWLQTVATRRSLDLVREASARRRYEEAPMPRKPDAGEPTWREIAPHIDKALAELSEEIRAPLVLHYLEDRGQEEVADELGVNQSTVSRRIEKGVAELREKLRKAGVVASAALLAALLGQEAAQAAPATLVASLGKMAISGVGEGALAGAATKAAATGLAALKTKLVVVSAAAVIVVGGVVAYNKLSEKEQKAPTGKANEAAKMQPAEPVAQHPTALAGPTVEPAAPKSTAVALGEAVNGLQLGIARKGGTGPAPFDRLAPLRVHVRNVGGKSLRFPRLTAMVRAQGCVMLEAFVGGKRPRPRASGSPGAVRAEDYTDLAPGATDSADIGFGPYASGLNTGEKADVVFVLNSRNFSMKWDPDTRQMRKMAGAWHGKARSGAAKIEIGPEAGPPLPKLGVTLEVRDRTRVARGARLGFTTATVRDMQLRFIVTNQTGRAIDPGLRESRLLVNGEPLSGGGDLPDWSFIIANGPRDDRWRKLPPRDRVSFSYAMGRYFAAPGLYRIVFVIGGVRSNTVEIEVTAKGGAAAARAAIKAPDAAEILSVEETLGAALLDHEAEGRLWYLCWRSNEGAKPGLYRILGCDKAERFHPGAILILGYVGDSSDAKKLERAVHEKFEGVVSGDKRNRLQAIFLSLGVMSGRGVEEATEIILKMTEVDYWRNVKFRLWPAHLAHLEPAPGFLYEMLYRVVWGYALSGNEDIEEVCSAILNRIDDPKIRKYMEGQIDPKAMRQRAVRQRSGEARPPGRQKDTGTPWGWGASWQERRKLLAGRYKEFAWVFKGEDKPWLSSPGECWSSLLGAMRKGDLTAVRALCTREGYRSLLSTADKGGSAGDRLRQLGRGWSKWQVRWGKATATAASAQMGPEVKEHGLEFRKVKGKWLLHRWRPGE